MQQAAAGGGASALRAIVTYGIYGNWNGPATFVIVLSIGKGACGGDALVLWWTGPTRGAFAARADRHEGNNRRSARHKLHAQDNFRACVGRPK